MPGDFHLHRARMNFSQARIISPNRPDPIYFVPGAFVTEHHQAWIGRRKLYVIEPVSGVMKSFYLSGFDVDGVKRHR